MKHLLSVILFTCSTLTAQITNGLIAHYSLNGSTNDQSSNANNGTNYGATSTTGRLGYANTAYSFDGNDYIFIPNSTSLNPTNGITISAWYKAISFAGAGYSTIISKGYTSHTSPTYQYKLGVTGDLYGGSAQGRFGFSITTSNNVGHSLFTSNNFWTPGTWYYIVGVYDGNQMRLYVNNLLISSQNVTGSLANYATNLNIANNTTVNDFLEGALDDVRIYDRPLSTSEIAQLYTATIPVSSFSSGSTSTICAGATITFTDLSSSNPVSWNWEVASGSSLNTYTVANPTITFHASGIYSITLKADGADEEGIPFTQIISVNNAATIAVSGSSQSVCSGTTISFQASGASTYSWSNGGGFNATVSYTPLSSAIYTVLGSNGGCTSSQTVSAVVLPSPTLATSGSHNVCNGQASTFVASGASTYTWSNAVVGPSITITPTANTVYSYTGTALNGCSKSNAFTIIVSSCTSLNQLSEGRVHFRAFPNPTQGKLYLQADAGESLRIVVINSLGKTLVDKNVPLEESDRTITLDLHSFSAGIYFLKVASSDEKFQTLKVIKE